MITVTVYSLGEGCPHCVRTCNCLTVAGIRSTVIDITVDEDARRFVTEQLGYAQAPVVVIDQDPAVHWCGFRPDLIQQVAKRAILPSDATRRPPIAGAAEG
ncbi:MAG: glutaredoxin family protein [Microbacterium sp.]